MDVQKTTKRLSKLDLKIANTTLSQLKEQVDPLGFVELLELAISNKKDLVIEFKHPVPSRGLIEKKTHQLLNQYAEQIKSSGIKISLISFSFLATLRNKKSSHQTGFLVKRKYLASINPSQVVSANLEIIKADHNFVSTQKKRGRKVMVWTVNEPEDLIKRCVWDSYVYYVVGSEKEAEKILKENQKLEISERAALIIGLLKVIETDNLIHKFNTYVVEILTNKSVHAPQKDGLLMRKKTFDLAVDKFLDKFPDYWEPTHRWTVSLKDLVDYIENIKRELESLEIHKVVDKNITYEFYNSNNIKKLLKFNY